MSRIGSLCSGYAGLDMAVHEVLGGLRRLLDTAEEGSRALSVTVFVRTRDGGLSVGEVRCGEEPAWCLAVLGPDGQPDLGDVPDDANGLGVISLSSSPTREAAALSLVPGITPQPATGLRVRCEVRNPQPASRAADPSAGETTCNTRKGARA